MTNDEADLVARCLRMWQMEGFSVGTIKIGKLSDELKAELRRLADECGASIEFDSIAGQPCINSKHRPKT